MPKKKTKEKLIATIESSMDLELALNRIEEIDEETAPLLAERNTLRAAATSYSVKTKTKLIELDGFYYRLVTRESRSWNALKLKKIIGKRKVEVSPGKKRKVWVLVTRRFVDTKLLQDAVTKGWLDEKEIKPAFELTPQTPFLQRYDGKAD